MQLQEKFITDSLQKFGDRIASQKNGGESPENPAPAEEKKPAEQEEHGLSPEQIESLRRQLDDAEHLRTDLQERLAADLAVCEERTALLRDRCSSAEELLRKMDELAAKNSALAVPGQETEDLSAVTEYVRSLKDLRLLHAREHALLEETDPADKPSPDRKNDTCGSLPGFRQAFQFFLPLGVILLVCTILLAIALVLAWKVPF